MKQITLNIPDRKFKSFLDLIGSLDYVKVEDIEQTALSELQNSLNQVKLIKQGKLPKQTAREFLDEI